MADKTTVKVNKDGSSTVEVLIGKGRQKWETNNLDQTKKHMPMFKEHLSKGDYSAMQDKVREVEKQRKS